MIELRYATEDNFTGKVLYPGAHCKLRRAVVDPGAEARRLEAAMKQAGFVGLATEWWHGGAPDASKFPLSDDPL